MDPRGRMDGGVAGVLRVAMPLVVASSGHALRLFADRVMLAQYSAEAIAASMPSGLLCFTMMSFFIGTAGYANAFVAQYMGAGMERRVGTAVWQGLFLSVAGGLAVALSALAAPAMFAWMGHGAEVQAEQVIYYRALARYSFAGIGLSAVNAFWSGRGRTGTVMGIELMSAGLNIVLNAAFIFGRFGAPQMGIEGAGLATGWSNLAGLVLALTLFLRPRHRRTYGTFPRPLFDPALAARLFRFGAPNGLQFMLDLMAFNLFVVFIGRTGAAALEAANIAFSLNALAFLPIIGLGTTASILVGQGVGAGDIALARRSVRSAFILAVLYNVGVGGLLVFLPGPMLALFVRAGDPAQAETLRIAAVCLRYIAAYLVFDAACIVYSHAIKGAGDTHFALRAGLALSWGTLVLPCYVALRLGAPSWVLWWILVIHVALAAAVYYARYVQGRWTAMRVIESADGRPPPAAGAAAEIDIQADRLP